MSILFPVWFYCEGFSNLSGQIFFLQKWKSEFVFFVLSKYHRSAWSCVFSPRAGKCSIKQPGMASLSCVGPVPGGGSDLKPCWVGSVPGNASAGNSRWWDEVFLLHSVMNTISWSKVRLAIPAVPAIPRPFSSFCCQDQALLPMTSITNWHSSLQYGKNSLVCSKWKGQQWQPSMYF